MQLKTLTYVSRASLDLTERDLVDILEAARRRNSLEGITGLLIFNGVRFLQIIEGAEGAIDGLVADLRRDPRHTSFELQDERIVDARSFPDWSMQLVQVNTTFQEARLAVNGALPDAVSPEIRDLVLANTQAIGAPVTLPG